MTKSTTHTHTYTPTVTHTHARMHAHSHTYTRKNERTHVCRLIYLDVLEESQLNFELTIFYISIEIQSCAVNKCGCKAREWEREFEDGRKERE